MALAPKIELGKKAALTVGPSLRLAISLLRMSNAELGDALARRARRNPYVRITRDSIDLETLVAEGSSLFSHALNQIGLVVRTDRDRSIALVFLEALEPSGWLGRDVPEIAASCGCSPDKAEAVLERLQTMEPAGLFARSLRECLSLQARDRGQLTQTVACILEHLEVMTEGGIEALEKASNLTRPVVEAALAIIRTLDPTPGSAFRFDTSVLRQPDVLVRRTGSGWQVELNRSTLPVIEISGDHGTIDAADALVEARRLAEMLDRRNTTVLQVTLETVAQQSEFLANFEASLRPLLHRDVAAAVGVHESTVSRAIQGLLLDTPRGLISIRSLFSRPAGLDRQSGRISTAEAQSRIRELIKAEHPSSRLNDAAISRALRGQGVHLARRTIAKHRAALGIPARSVRRKAVTRA